MSFSVAEQQTRDTTATNSSCPNKILRIASLHTVLTFEVNDENYSYKYNIEISVFSVFICRYSVFFGISNTDVGIGILKYCGIGIDIPTHLYLQALAETMQSRH
jgi:hypothetical protein